MFGVWPTDDEAKTLANWRGYARLFVLNRLLQRFIFNRGIKKVKKLREATVAIIEKYNLCDIFVRINDGLPSEHQRKPVVRLCDEIMYGVGFAGIGGTCACVESVSQFLQKKTGEVPPDSVNFKDYASSIELIAAYKENSVTFIKETCRLDPPVTSATTVLKSTTKFDLGKPLTMNEGMLQQYTIALANRDPSVFSEPDVFNPKRDNLNLALTWNGAFVEEEELTYPRICPGRYLAIDVARTIIDLSLSQIPPELHRP